MPQKALFHSDFDYSQIVKSFRQKVTSTHTDRGIMQDSNCDGCFFATPTVTDDAELGVKCHRFPPVIFVLEGEVTQTFPDAYDKCGEYKS